MAEQEPSIGVLRWSSKVVFQLIMILLIALLFLLATVDTWTGTSSDIRVIGAERDGIRYLRPLTALMTELGQARSIAVRGGQIQEDSLRRAVASVDSADRASGVKLSVRRRWTDIRKAINTVVTAKPVLAAAVDEYGDVVVLVRQLVREVADGSKLVLDPEIDSSYLVDAVLRYLPDVTIGAGVAADLALIDPADGDAPAGGVDSATQARVAVARYSVAVAAEAVSIDLGRSLEQSTERDLGANITRQLDAFRSAVDAFVPSGTRLRGLEPTDPATLSRTGLQVQQAAQGLVDAVLDELDGVLRARAHAIGWQRLRSAGLTGLGLLIALFLAGWCVRNGWDGTDGGPEPTDDPQVPARRTPVSTRGSKETTPIDPRDLLAVQELLHAGRPGDSRRRERGNDAG
jgi:hypothetical protein